MRHPGLVSFASRSRFFYDVLLTYGKTPTEAYRLAVHCTVFEIIDDSVTVLLHERNNSIKPRFQMVIHAHTALSYVRQTLADGTPTVQWLAEMDTLFCNLFPDRQKSTESHTAKKA